MKNLIAVIALTLTLVSAVGAADEKSAGKQPGVTQDDMMKNCQSHMRDGTMMDSLPKDKMARCQEMMKSGGMMKGEMQQQQQKMEDMKPSGAAKSNTPQAAGDADHAKHHPAQ